MKESARDRTTSSVASSNRSNQSNQSHSSSASGGSGGRIQLLSPTFQQSIDARSNAVKPLTTASRITKVTTSKGTAFDFDSFTLESVKAAKAAAKPQTDSEVAASSSSGLSIQTEKLAAEFDAQPSPDFSSSFHTVRSTDDLDSHENHRRWGRHASTASSGISPSASSGTVTTNGVPVAFKRVSHAVEMAARRKKTAVLMSGWLQKRKGLVLKRWKAYYCLLRDDDTLCLYASEDTVNGRVEQRFQLLRVLLTDKSDAFHVIGVGSDGTPRKEEFRALHSADWAGWFRFAFRDFLDAVSLQGVLSRKPELLLLSPVNRDRGGSEDSNECGGNQSSHDRQPQHQQRVHSYSNRHPHHLYNERKSIVAMPKRKHTASSACSSSSTNTRESYDNFSDCATRSTISAFSSVSSWTNPSVDGGNKTGEEDSAISDCPIVIERDWQLPVLESRRGSKSLTATTATTTRSSDVVKPSAFSWSS